MKSAFVYMTLLFLVIEDEIASSDVSSAAASLVRDIVTREESVAYQENRCDLVFSDRDDDDTLKLLASHFSDAENAIFFTSRHPHWPQLVQSRARCLAVVFTSLEMLRAAEETKCILVEPRTDDQQQFAVSLYCPSCAIKSPIKGVTSWDPTRGYSEPLSPPFAITRLCAHPLDGCRLNVSFIGVAPFIVYGQPVRGCDVQILEALAERFHFTYELVPELLHGKFDGKWTGMVASVTSGSSDLGIGGPSMTLARSRAVHFAVGTHSIEYVYASTMPRPVDPFLNIVKVFDTKTWTGVIVCSLLFAVLFGGLHQCYRSCDNFLRSPAWLGSKRSLNFFFLRSVSVLAGQPIQESRGLFPGSSGFVAGPAALMVWLLCAAILGAAYKSMILAHLVSVDYEKPIQTTKDILDSGKTLFLPVETGLLAAFETSPKAIHRKAVQHSLDTGGHFKLDEGHLPVWVHEKLDYPGGSFVAFKDANVSRFHLGREVLLSVQVAFMINKKRSWKRDFDWTIQALKEAGIISKYIEDHNPNRKAKKKSSKDEKDALPLTCAHVKGSLAFLGLGAATAAIALAAEIYTAKHRNV